MADYTWDVAGSGTGLRGLSVKFGIPSSCASSETLILHQLPQRFRLLSVATSEKGEQLSVFLNERAGRPRLHRIPPTCRIPGEAALRSHRNPSVHFSTRSAQFCANGSLLARVLFDVALGHVLKYCETCMRTSLR
jgi:hypothetical protein